MLDDDCTCVTTEVDGFVWTILADPRCPEHGPCSFGWHNPACEYTSVVPTPPDPYAVPL